MCILILVSVIAKRLLLWAQWLGQLDGIQASFWTGRNSAEVVQMMVQMGEDLEDFRRRTNDMNEYN